jgi:hypothetical protein
MDSIQSQLDVLNHEISDLKAVLSAIQKPDTTANENLKELVEKYMNSILERRETVSSPPPDYASLAAGTIPVLDLTSPILSRPGLDPISSILGIGKIGQPPSVALSDDNTMGKCFAFSGSSGKLTIQLKRPILPTAVSIDHIRSSEVPDRSSAPRHCQVWALENTHSEQDAVLLGSFEYLLSDKPQSERQYFPLSHNDTVSNWDVLQLRILSNWGRDDYTCLYRWRVHAQRP